MPQVDIREGQEWQNKSIKSEAYDPQRHIVRKHVSKPFQNGYLSNLRRDANHLVFEPLEVSVENKYKRTNIIGCPLRNLPGCLKLTNPTVIAIIEKLAHLNAEQKRVMIDLLRKQEEYQDRKHHLASRSGSKILLMTLWNKFVIRS